MRPFCRTLSFATAVLYGYGSSMVHLSCSSKAVKSPDYQLLLKSPIPTLLAGSVPGSYHYAYFLWNHYNRIVCAWDGSSDERSSPRKCENYRNLRSAWGGSHITLMLQASSMIIETVMLAFIYIIT